MDSGRKGQKCQKKKKAEELSTNNYLISFVKEIGVRFEYFLLGLGVVIVPVWIIDNHWIHE